MNKDKEIFFLLSGEGENGTWEIVETDDISEVLKKERCNGDRWAHAYSAKTAFITEWDDVCALDCETHTSFAIYNEEIIDFVKEQKEG